MRTLTEQDLDQLSWHDNHCHGFRIMAGVHGAGQLILDLDYILEWRRATESTFQFLIVPATLTFQQVTNLKIELDYAVATAAMSPFSMDGIRRTLEQRERNLAQVWHIDINWREGEIRFEASGFEQRTTGEPVLSDAMYLEAKDRPS